MKNYKFSIITVTLNSEKFLERCLKSVKQQTYKNFEHIIVDGGSSDTTKKILDNNKSNFSKMILEKDNSIWEAMNKGIKVSSGEIICFLNSDDHFYPQSLNLVNEYFNNFEIDFLFGSVKKYKIMHGYQPWKIKWSFGFYSSHSVGFFIKKEKHVEVGYYNDRFLSADLDFFYKMIVNYRLKGMSTQKYQVLGEFEKGGFSSKVSYLRHLKDLNKIRIHNKQLKIFVNFLFLVKILKSPIKFLKTIIGNE
mgnify:CR=1 FL=1